MTTAGWVSLLGFIPLFLGLPLYWLSSSVPGGDEPVDGLGPLGPVGHTPRRLREADLTELPAAIAGSLKPIG